MRCLIVEDDPSNAILNSEVVLEHDASASFVTVATVDAARAALQAQDFDLMLLDLQLPDGHGFDVLAWQRKMRVNPKMETIIVTASGNPDVAKAQELGVHRLFVKPLNVELLSEATAALHFSDSASIVRHPADS